MGSFICSISERDWQIAKTKGIYGNKAGRIGENGKYFEFSPSVKYSIIRDLVGMRNGDKVFFHVITKKGYSRIHGIYIVRETAFYDLLKIWDDDMELFPYRFLFGPHPNYKYLCKRDAYIEVIDFYELIEQRKIWSLATLENEMNIEARSVKKIEDGIEAKEILRLLHRDFKYRISDSEIQFSPISISCTAKPLQSLINEIGRYENSIKALLMYKISQNNRSILEILGSVADFMNEVFIAQTTRKSIDILCIQNYLNNSKKYTICEVKTSKCEVGSLKQLLYYMDLFKRKDLVDLDNDIITGCLIGQKFAAEVIDFSRQRNAQNVNGNIILIEYKPIQNGSDANFRRIA